MKNLTIILLSIITLSCCYSQTQNDPSADDYLVINVFLEQLEPFIHLNLSIANENKSDYESFEMAYERKRRMYNSFRNLCRKNLDKEVLDYDTNLSCSIAEKFKVYENLFSKNDLLYLKNTMKNNQKFSLDSSKILIPNIQYLENSSPKKTLVIHSLFYNEEKNKVLIKYSLNKKNLYHVLKKENGWWKNIINFDH